MMILRDRLLLTMCGRREQKPHSEFTPKLKTVKLLKLYYYMWNHREKCIQMGTNMSGIGALIREIDIDLSEI